VLFSLKNMPKSILLSLKNCKNRQTLGALSPDHLASGGWKLSLKIPTSVILHCEFFSLHLLTNHRLFRNQTKTLFSCNYSGSAPDIRCRKKNLLYYVCHRLPYGNQNHRFQTFSFFPPPH